MTTPPTKATKESSATLLSERMSVVGSRRKAQQPRTSTLGAGIESPMKRVRIPPAESAEATTYETQQRKAKVV